VAVLAVQQIRRMRGGAQGQLMLGSDRELYVVKFQNNPQHVRVLANEFLATRLAEAIGLPVPKCDVVEVSAWLIENTAELRIVGSRQQEELCKAGLQFGSKFVGGLMPGQRLDYLPEEQLHEVKNLQDFAGMLALDKWTGNANGRQAVFVRRQREKRYGAVFIDQGYCFHAGEWRFADSPLRGIYGRNAVYARVSGWDDFEPWLARIEAIGVETLWRAAEEIPPEWYEQDTEGLERLVHQLMGRKERVRELIAAFRDSERQPFPQWGKSVERERKFVDWKAAGEIPN
jgi:hypothetical protein